MPVGTIDKKFLNLMMTFELFKNSDGHCICMHIDNAWTILFIH